MAISMPDSLAKRVDVHARRTGISRSEFLQKAAERYLQSLSDEQVTVVWRDADDELKRFNDRAARRALLAVEWQE